MSRSRRLAAVLLTIIACAPAIGAGTESSLKALMQARYNALKVTTQARDRAGMATFFDPGFVSIDPDGKKTSLKQMIDGMPSTPPDPNSKSGTTVLSVVRKENTATVVTRVDGRLIGKEPDGSPDSREYSARSTDTWVLAHGRWLWKLSTTDTFDLKINGVLVVHRTFSST